MKLLAILLAYVLALHSALAQPRPEVKIGAILPLTGSISSVGDAMQRGMRMAAQDTKHISVKLIVEDDATASRTNAVSAAKKLSSVDGVTIIFNAYASTVSAFSAVLQKAGVPCLVLWDSNRSLPKLGKQIIGFGYENELSGEDMAEFSRRTLKHTTVGIVSLHDEWSEVITSAFETRFKGLGGKVALHEQVNGDTTDFRTIMARVKALKVDALYLTLYGVSLHSAIKQARAAGFEGALLTTDSFVDADIAATAPASEGSYLTQIWLTDNDFARAYERSYGRAASSGTNLGYAALAYDAVMLMDALAAKIQQQGAAISSESLLKNLPNFSFEGVLGPMTFSATNSVARREKILQVKNGRFVELPQGTHP
jgi:branched-chain amino acid transport system substrate-binding protein